MTQQIITVVSGLPRSGTSLLMQMLEAGGMEILTDNSRKTDEDNPKGYYEFEKVKGLSKDNLWLKDAKGKAIKIISALLEYIPSIYNYKNFFMRRNIDEIIVSQKQMLIRRGLSTDEVNDEMTKRIFLKHIRQVEDWLNKQQNIDVFYVNYNEVVKDPVKYSEKINQFLGNILNTEHMVSVVDEILYRHRCEPFVYYGN